MPDPRGHRSRRVRPLFPSSSTWGASPRRTQDPRQSLRALGARAGPVRCPRCRRALRLALPAEPHRLNEPPPRHANPDSTDLETSARQMPVMQTERSVIADSHPGSRETSPSGRSSCAVIAPSCFGSRDLRAGPRRDSREVLPSAGGRRVLDVVDGVVVGEVALSLAPHLAKNPYVRIAHVRAPPGLGTSNETATAWGSSCGRSSGPTRWKPNVRSRSAMS
jgi:hypothetical protein